MSTNDSSPELSAAKTDGRIAPATEKVSDRNIKLFGLTEPAHLHGYQPTDWEVIDYQQYPFPGTKLYFRGPSYKEALASKKKKVAFIGAAQFLGRLCPISLPDMVGTQADAATLNFGFSGGSPDFFSAMPDEFFDAVNACDLVFLQVMSARASPNSFLQVARPQHPNDLRVIGTDQVLFMNNAWNHLIDNIPARKLWQAVLQTRNAYVKSMLALRKKIRAKTVLVWISERPMDYSFKQIALDDITGSFPHFVTQPMVETLAASCDSMLHCISSRGRPHRVVSRFDGKPVAIFTHKADPSENYYYPTPEMLEDAAAVIVPYVKAAHG